MTGNENLNIDQPSIARVYDYLLGGRANFAVDREVADELLEAVPGQLAYARANRDFLRRAVTELCRAGYDQFLDLGSGVPTVGNVHEVAQRVHPDARVAYVDIDPVAVHHSRELLRTAGASASVTATEADMRDPGGVLGSTGVSELLDFTRPVAVLTVAILDIIDTRNTLDPVSILAAYRDACAPGSALVISNGAQLSWTDEEIAAADAMMAQTPTPLVTWRTAEQVEALFAGYRVLEPGVVPTAAWRPDRAVTEQQVQESNCLAGVGVL